MPFTLLTNRFKRDSFQHFDSFEKRKHQSAYKPGSVHMVSHVGWPFIWSLCCHKLRATNPGSKSESTPTSQDVMPPLFGFAPGGVCLAKPCCQSRGALLPHLFTLTRLCLSASVGGLFLWHFPWGCPRRALPGTLIPWSPDFPPPLPFRASPFEQCEGGHPADWSGGVRRDAAARQPVPCNRAKLHHLIVWPKGQII